MKYIHKLLAALHVFVILLVVMSCSPDNEVEPLFDQSINQRTEALKTQYSNILTSPDNGWIGYYSPNNNFGFYNVLLDFKSNGNVSIQSDYEEGSANNNITYRIDKTLKIELVFESSSVFSEIFAINRNNNDGEFVFNILSATTNEIILESKLDFGDDVTIFRLRRARAEELDLTPVYASVNNISGDTTNSVYRNILFNNNIIGTFNFNPITRFATITYIVNGVEQVVTVPILITATGFSFVEPLNVNGVFLNSFEFNATENQYANPADALLIKYDNFPAFPTNAVEQIGLPGHQVFGYSIAYGSNPLTSPNFNNLINRVNQNIQDLGSFAANWSFSAFEYYAQPDANGNIQIFIGVYDANQDVTYWSGFLFSQNIDNNKLNLSFLGILNENANFFFDALVPLLQFFNSNQGLYFTDNGTFSSNTFAFSNSSSTFTSAQDPSLRVYGLWFN